MGFTFLQPILRLPSTHPTLANHEIVRKPHSKYLDFGVERVGPASISDIALSSSKPRATAP
jgi:hypothetical protein